MTRKTAPLGAVFSSACQKSHRLFCTLKKRHIFCEAYASRKISLRSSKSLIAQALLMAIIQLEAGLAPSNSPAAHLSFLSGIGILQSDEKTAPLGAVFSYLFQQLQRFGYFLELHAVRRFYKHGIALINKLRQRVYKLGIARKVQRTDILRGAAGVL